MVRPRLPRRTAADGAGGQGGVAARRAVARWAWRLFRREWRQQVVVIALLVVAVTAAVGSMAVAYHSVPLREAEFGAAAELWELDGSDPQRLAADVARLEEWSGTIEVIGHWEAQVPGSVESFDIRAQDHRGAYSRPMLSLRQGRYPGRADEVAVTDEVAAAHQVGIGDRLELDARRRNVVGVVENPGDLDDEFALVAPSPAERPETMTVLLDPGRDDLDLTALGSVLNVQTRGQTEDDTAAAGTLAVATVAMVLVALVAAAGFVVVAQRRLRQLGMLAAVGATERHLRVVVLANGLAVGVVAAVLGTAAGLAGWVVLAPRLETAFGHRIDRFDLPWWLIAAGLLLAVTTAVGAAWWPARSMARVPVVRALSGRPPRPKPVRRSALFGALLLALGGAAIASGTNVKEDEGNDLLLVGGMVALMVGVLFVCPLAIRLAGLVSRRSPIGVRLALRDLRRYQARSGAALAAISLGVGIAVAIVGVAAATQHPPDGGNLSSRQVMVRVDVGNEVGSPVDAPQLSAAELERRQAAVDRIAATLDEATVVELDVPVDPEFEEPRGGEVLHPPVVLATPVDEDTYRDSGPIYVATPQALDLLGVDPGSIDGGGEVLTALSGQLYFVNTRDAAQPVERVEALDGSGAAVEVPNYRSAPRSLITPDAMRRRGWEPVRAAWFLEAAAPISGAQRERAREIAAEVGLSVETRDQQTGLTTVRSGATAVGVALALAILAMTVGLMRGEAAGDLRTLTATGASGATRRALTASTAGSLALLGALVGTIGAYLGLGVGYSDDISRLGRIPAVPLVVILVGLPLVTTAAAWLLAGREPATVTRQPIE